MKKDRNTEMITLFKKYKNAAIWTLIIVMTILVASMRGLLGGDPHFREDFSHKFDHQEIEWLPCDGHYNSPEMQCASLQIPRDYKDPETDIWTMAVARLPALDKESPEVIVTNPGGPGISGIDELAKSGNDWKSLRAKFDIVTFDPRGVGSSFPVVPNANEKISDAIRNQPSVPHSSIAVSYAIAFAQALADDVKLSMGDDLRYLSTRYVAHDMDLLRSALGEEKLNYFGFSYGTYLGAVYADMFPGRTSRMVLDSAQNPSNDYTSLSYGQALSFEESIRTFMSNCNNHENCSMKNDAIELNQVMDAITKLDANPFIDDTGRALSGSKMFNYIAAAMYEPENSGPELQKILEYAVVENWGKVLDAVYDPKQLVNPVNVTYLSTTCLDLGTNISPDEIPQLAEEWSKDAPLAGASLAWSVLRCSVWPVKPTDTPKVIHAPNSGDVLVIGVTGDPATPVEWSRELAHMLDHAHYIEWEGTGHIAYPRAGRSVADAVDRFFEFGILPDNGAVFHSEDGPR